MPLSRKYVPLDSDSDDGQRSTSSIEDCVKSAGVSQKRENGGGTKSRWKEWRKKLRSSGEELREGRREGESAAHSGMECTASSSKPQGITMTKRQEDEKRRKKQPWWDVIAFAGPF